VAKRPLLQQLFVSYLWVTVAVVIIGGVYAGHVMRRFHLDQAESDLEARARLCVKPIVELLEAGKRDEIDALCGELGTDEGIRTRITVVLPDGDVVGDTLEDPARMDDHDDRPEIIEAMTSSRGVGQSTRFSDTTKQRRMYVAVAVRQPDESLVAIVRMSVSVTALDDAVAGIYRRIAVGGLAATVLIAAVSWWFSRRVGRPLQEMTRGAQRFAQGELQHRLPEGGSQEVAALSEAMSRMAEQLDDRIRTVTRQQNEQQAMLVSMDEGVLAVDLDRRIISLNQACARLLGVEIDAIKGRVFHEVVRKPDLLEFLDSVLTGSAPVEDVIQLRGVEDRELRVHGTALRDAQQEKIGALLVMYDVTRLHRLETVRRDFVANVSHELGTPITAIKGFVESLLDGALEDQENSRRFLQIVLNQANRMDATVEDLLTLSRLDAEERPPEIEFRLDSVAGVLRSAVQGCEAAASARDVQIQWRCAEDLDAEIDALLLERAVINLVDNAVKYCGAGTSVRVTANLEGDSVRICVADQGDGIAAGHLPRLFERFYRVDKARSRELGGTGLGLAIVKHIALMHHGAVGVESTVGQGSTFCITLPLSQADAEAKKG